MISQGRDPSHQLVVRAADIANRRRQSSGIGISWVMRHDKTPNGIHIKHPESGNLNGILSRRTAVKARDQDNPTSMRRHALPQLTFPLSSLQLQPLNCILQSLLLLNQSSQLHCLRSISRTPTAKRSTALAAVRLTGSIRRRESSFLELAFSL